MGRAMVRNPKVFLFDEPLSNLDAKLRSEVRTEIKALSQQLKTTMVFVTHDQIEAMTMADRIVILKAGVVQQVGTPEAVYQRPANRFVAGFIGSPTMNFFDVTVEDDAARLADGTQIVLPPGTLAAVHRANVRDAVLGVRPEHLRLLAPEEAGLRVTVNVVEPLGSDTLLYFGSNGSRHVARVAPELHVRPGDTVTLGVVPGKVHLFQPGEDGAVLRDERG
jgi:multiple sugar transport system ATP-binding protein